MAENCGYEKYSYGEHYLQNVYVHIPPSPAPADTGYWVVYVSINIYLYI